MPAATDRKKQAKKKAKGGAKHRDAALIAKFFLAVFLLPACVGTAVVTFRMFIDPVVVLREQFWFWTGIGAYVLLYSLLQNPIQTYVFGHELSHAVWTWLFQGKVMSFQAGKTGGSVLVSKSNMFISLAPYFFPIYTVALALLYGICGAFWPVEKYVQLYRFIIGFSLGFHGILTLYALLKDQDDVRENGIFFSLVFLLFSNLLVFGLLGVHLSDHVTLTGYANYLTKEIASTYARLGDINIF